MDIMLYCYSKELNIVFTPIFDCLLNRQQLMLDANLSYNQYQSYLLIHKEIELKPFGLS